MAVTLPVGHDLVADPDHTPGHGHQLHGEPRGPVPLPVLRQGADRLVPALQGAGLDRGQDAAVDGLDDPELDRTDAHPVPAVLLERVEVAVDDQVGAEPLHDERCARSLAPLERGLGHPVAQPAQRGGGREGHRVGVGEGSRLPRSGVGGAQRSGRVHVDEPQVVTAQDVAEPCTGVLGCGHALQPTTVDAHRERWAGWLLDVERLEPGGGQPQGHGQPGVGRRGVGGDGEQAGLLTGRDALTGAVDDHPAAVAGQSPRLDVAVQHRTHRGALDRVQVQAVEPDHATGRTGPTSPIVRTTLASPSARSYSAPTTPRAPERMRSAMSVERSLIRSQVRSTCSRSICSMVGVRPPREAARTLGVTRSTMSRRKPPGTSPVRTATSAALTAPHESWPSTTMSGQSRTPTPNSSEPSTLGSMTWPAVRTTKRSPRPWSKMISAATRESAQPKKIANGFCLAAIRCRKCTSWCGWARSSAMNLALPAVSTRQASSGVRGRVPGCVRCRSITVRTLPAWDRRAQISPVRFSIVKATGLVTEAKKSLPLSSTTTKAGKSSTSIFQIASIPSSGYSSTSTLLMQSCASRAAGPPIEPR